MGNKRGTNEERGRVVDYAIDVLRIKRPRAYILENVRGLLNSNNGEDFKRLQGMIKSAGYSFQYQMLRCEDFGIPQTRHRVFMVGMRDGYPEGFQYPRPSGKCPTLSEYLGMDIVKTMSNTVRCSGRKSGVDNAKNWSAYRTKDGNVFEYTVKHVTALQGFPADFNWGGAPDSQRWKMMGNTIPTCLSRAILGAVANHINAHPERPAASLSIIPHPPPARVIIERHLKRCDDIVSRKRRVGSSGKKKDAGSDDNDDDDAGSQETTVGEEEEEKEEKSSSDDSTANEEDAPPCDATQRKHRPHDETQQPPSKHKRMETADEVDMERIIKDASNDGSSRSRPSFITLKSGTSISLALPGDMQEQFYILKIVR
jgi:hypothetical protein